MMSSRNLKILAGLPVNSMPKWLSTSIYNDTRVTKSRGKHSCCKSLCCKSHNQYLQNQVKSSLSSSSSSLSSSSLSSSSSSASSLSSLSLSSSLLSSLAFFPLSSSLSSPFSFASSKKFNAQQHLPIGFLPKLHYCTTSRVNVSSSQKKQSGEQVNQIDSLLSNFNAPIAYAFGYGSGVFKQTSNVDINNMVDLVFAVEDPVEFHKMNLDQHKNHYSFLSRISGPFGISNLQTNFGAHIYYNTLVECNGQMIKYGVISITDLKRDLSNWETLYVSGRLHKPVYTLKKGDNELQSLLKENLLYAVCCSLLLLPEKFTERDLYLAIAGLSYTGDFRMTFGENPKKVQNIVDGNFTGFQGLYRPVLQEINGLVMDEDDNIVFDQQQKLVLINNLPQNVQKYIKKNNLALQDVLKKPIIINSAIQSIISRSSKTQSAKGVLTAGVQKSIIYIMNKLKKYYK